MAHTSRPAFCTSSRQAEAFLVEEPGPRGAPRGLKGQGRVGIESCRYGGSFCPFAGVSSHIRLKKYEIVCVCSFSELAIVLCICLHWQLLISFGGPVIGSFTLV